MTVFRESILVEVYSKVQESIHQKEPGLLEIVGLPGTGKTVMLDQVNEYLRLSGVNVQHIPLKATSRQSVGGLLHEFAKDSGLAAPGGENPVSELSAVYSLLSHMQNPIFDALLILIDDAHLLFEDSIHTIRKIFNPLFSSGSFFCVLAGRPGWERNGAVSMSGFSRPEGKLYLEKRVEAQWEPLYSEQVDFLLNAIQSNPLHLCLLVDHLIDQKLLSPDGYIAFTDKMKSLPLPKSLEDHISSRFDMKTLSLLYRQLLSVMAISKDYQLISERASILFPNMDISHLITSGWIVELEGYIRFSHSLIPHIILESLTPEEKEKWSNRILTSTKLNADEKAYYLLNLSRYTKNDIIILENHAKTLGKNARFQSALIVLDTLYEKTGDIKYLPDMGGIHYELQQIEKAKEIFQKVLKSPKYFDHPSSHYYLGEILTKQGQPEAAIRYFNKTESLLTPSYKNYFTIQKNIILFYLRKGDKTGFSLRFNLFRKNYEHSSKYRLEYLILLGRVSDLSEIKLDIEKPAIEGLKIARKRNLPEYERSFINTLIRFYEKQGEISKAFELVKQMDGNDANHHILENDAYELSLQGRIYYHVGQYKKALDLNRHAAGIFQYMSLPHYYLDCLQVVSSIEGVVGNIAAMKRTINTIEEGILNKPKYEFQLPIYTLASVYQFLGNPQKAKSILENLYSEVKDKIDLSMVPYIQATLANVIFPHDEEKAWKYWNMGHEYFTVNRLNSSLAVEYFNMGWTLVTNKKLDKLDSILGLWQKHIGNGENTFHYQYVKAASEILNGKLSSGLTRIRLLETYFDGSSMWEWKKLYEWVSRQKIKPSSKKTYAYRSKVIEFICLNEKITHSLKIPGKFTSLDLLLEGWSKAITTNRLLDSNLIEDYFNDYERQEEFKNTLQIWDITCSDFSIISSYASGKPVVINLLGSPEIYINNRKLTSRDWKSRKALEILIYILIKSWRHKKAVDKHELLLDLWAPTSDRMESARMVRNNMMTRLRKIFVECKVDMLPKRPDDILFN